MVNLSFRRSRWLMPALLAGGAVAPLPFAPLNAQGISPAVNPCTGISVDQASLRTVLTATSTPITAALQGKINALAGLPLLGGLVTPLALDVGAIVDVAVTVNPLTLRVLDTAGNAVLPGACNLTSDALTLNTQGGIAIGGNAVTGLGLNGLAAAAGTSDSIALGNNASTGALANGAVAIGTGANVTAVNGVALGNGSVAARAALTGYAALGIGGTSNSVGAISIGATGALRQLTNLAPGSALTDAATVGQLQGAFDAVATVNAAVGVNTAAITGLSTGLAALDGQVTVNTTGIAGLTTDLAALDVRVTANATALSGLNTTVTGLGTTVTNLATTVTGLGTDVAGLTTGLAALGGQVTGLATGLTALDGRVTGIATDVAGLTTGLATLSGQVAGNTTAIANIDVRVLNNTNAITNIDARVLSNTTDIANIDARVTNNTTQLGNIDARVTLNTTAITNLQTQVANVPVGYVQDANPTVPSAVPTNTAALIGVGGAAARLTNIAAGTVATGSTDAVTGGQLAATNAALATTISATTTNQAAIAALDASAVKYDNAAQSSVTLAGAGGTRLANVAAGTVAAGSTEAINGAQLAATNAQVTQNTTAIANITTTMRGSTVAAVQYSNPDTPTASNGGTITNDVTLIGAVAAAPVAIHNVAAGRTATDAVNLGQVQSQLATAMASAQSYTDSRVAAAVGTLGTRLDQVDFDLGELRKDALSGVAGALAFAGIPQTMDPGKALLGGAVAHYRGRTAFAFGFSSGVNDGKAAVKVGGSLDSSGHLGVIAGGGIAF